MSVRKRMTPEQEHRLMLWVALFPPNRVGSAALESYAETRGISGDLDAMLMSWVDMGWYDYGVALRAGWLTDAGLSHLSQMHVL